MGKHDQESAAVGVDARADADAPRRIRQIADPRPRAPLLVEGQERPLIGHVVHEDGDVPTAVEESDQLKSVPNRTAMMIEAIAAGTTKRMMYHHTSYRNQAGSLPSTSSAREALRVMNHPAAIAMPRPPMGSIPPVANSDR